MNFHAELRSKYPQAIVSSCDKRGCRLRLDGLSHRPTLIDADLYCVITGHKGKICDYFVFPDLPRLVGMVVEMKAGGLDVRHAVEQLAAGACAVESIIGGREIATFCPLLLSEKGPHPSEAKLIGRLRIRFRGGNWPVKRKRCGVTLAEVLRELAV